MPMFEKWHDPGISIPLAHDGASNKPSITLLMVFVANALAMALLLALFIFGDRVAATAMTCTYAVICTVLYIMRKLQKAKFDLDDKSIELDSGEDTDVKKDS